MTHELIYNRDGLSFYVADDAVADWLAIERGSDHPRQGTAPFSTADPLTPDMRAAKIHARRHAMMLRQLRPGGKIAKQAAQNEAVAAQATGRIALGQDTDGGASAQLAEAEAAGCTIAGRCEAVCAKYPDLDFADYADRFDADGNVKAPPSATPELGALLAVAAVAAATGPKLLAPIVFLFAIVALLVLRTKKDAFETEYQNHIFQNAAIPDIGNAAGLPVAGAEGSLWVALFSTTPTDSTAGTEVSYTGYSRADGAVARNSSNWTELNGNIENTNDITHGELTAGAVTVTGFGIMKLSAAGVAIYYGDFTAPKLVSVGTTPRILAGDLDIQED